MDGIQDVLGHASARITDADGAAALADQGLHDDEDALRFAAGLLGEAVLVELVDRLTLALAGFLLLLANDFPAFLSPKAKAPMNESKCDLPEPNSA